MLGGIAPAAAQVVGEQTVESDVIIVSATRRDEDLQDVPISLQVLGEEELEQQSVASFDDYARLLPSVSFQSFGPGQTQLSFRGITSGGDGLDAGSLPATGVYLDDVPVTTIASLVDLHIYDVARVEALSGPQGTLFGASSLSGTLRIITNKPDPSRFEGGYDLQVNKYGAGDFGGQVEGFLNLPLASNAAIRLVGWYSKEGGYIDNTYAERTYTLDDFDPSTNLTVDNSEYVEDDFNDVETYGGRAALKVDLDEDWTATPMFMYQNQQTNGSFLYDPTLGDLEVHDFVPEYNTDEWWQAALTIEGKIGNWDVVYSAGYFERETENEIDYSYYTVAYDTYGYYATYFPDPSGGYLDPTQRQYYNYNFTKHTHELRFISPSHASLRMTAGLFYQRQTNDIDAQYFIPGLSTSPVTSVWFNPIFDDVVYLKRLDRADNDYAMFTEVEYDITPALTLTAGIRGFMAHNTLIGFSGFEYSTYSDCLPTDDPDIPCVNVYPEGAAAAMPKKVDESGETHKVSLSWDVDPDRMVYATYSTGYRPGGINRDPAYGAYAADKLSNYEIGWKTSWLDGMFRWNGAVFYQDWTDMQFALARPGDNGVTSIANVGGAESKGVEMDLLFRSGGLSLSAAGSYVDAHITTPFCQEDWTGAIYCTPEGTRLPVQPKFKVNGTARYDFMLGGDTGAFVQAGVQHQGGTRSFLLDDEVAVIGYTDGFTTVDFAAGIHFGDMSIEAFIQNAFDERGQLSRNTACAPAYCGSYYRIYPVQPQFFGLKFSHRFRD
ncbi:TonB-dependent receptor [Sphingosinithalassobacter tenebrarum]|uniref:TonB-dependent receptor n=2 Tax=Stakelama tenebrarum TaxID=2711215 RepID=A0A6G6YBD5_9SPHN|nr:TonB-dependent receptor [Sphingosinithalassobacter tenebrarum]